MIIKPKKWKKGGGISLKRPRFRGLVTYMLQGKGTERCTWYLAGNLEGIDRQEDADVAIHVVEAFQRANTRVKGDRTYHLIISLHPDDRSLSERELEVVVRRAVHAAGFGEHQHIAVRHSDQEHVHVAVNQIQPKTRKIHHLWRDVEAFKALASELEVELGLHQVDRSVRRIDSDRSRDYESARALILLKSETVIGWHRKGFKLYWSRNRGGRPPIDAEIRTLIARPQTARPFRATIGTATTFQCFEERQDLQRCAVEKDADPVANLNRCEV